MVEESSGYWEAVETAFGALSNVSIFARVVLRTASVLFPSLSKRSSGGLWSLAPLPPGVGGPSRSSAGPIFGEVAVNHSSEMGSDLTWARCLLGRTWRKELLPTAVVDLQRRGEWALAAGLLIHLEEAKAGQRAGPGSLRIGLEVIWAVEAFLRIESLEEMEEELIREVVWQRESSQEKYRGRVTSWRKWKQWTRWRQGRRQQPIATAPSNVTSRRNPSHILHLPLIHQQQGHCCLSAAQIGLFL